ncbi:hypothetical protein KEM54_003978, partial [Ascosphaera aggregata]
MILYYKGSRLCAGKLGGGWVGYYRCQRVNSLSGVANIGDTAEVPDPEAIAALGAPLSPVRLLPAPMAHNLRTDPGILSLVFPNRVHSQGNKAASQQAKLDPACTLTDSVVLKL